MNSFEASVIIAFYNKLHFLKLVLAGFENQSVKSFEIIIADDGSAKNVVEELTVLIKQSPLHIGHIWHEDKGWRKNEMLNKAVSASKSNYLIFIDGDCIPHSRFVEGHLAEKQPGVCLTGRRVNLSENITTMLTLQHIEKRFLEKNFMYLMKDVYFGKSNHVGQSIYLKAGFLRRLANQKKRGILGCNFSLFKADLLQINGFDERYKAPSIGEDTDIQYRLELCGIKIKSLIHIAIQYHLYHKELPRKNENFAIFAQVKAENKAYTPYGIKKGA